MPDKAPIDPDDHSAANQMRMLIEISAKLDVLQARITLIFWLVAALFLAWGIEVIEEFL